MSASNRRAVGPCVLAALALVLSGCGGFGGFGGDEPEKEPREPLRTYVALGDGFAAAPYVGRTDRARGCLRSATNYPARVASRLGATLTDVTCTGASTDAVLRESEAPNGKGKLPAQLDAVTADTDLVTITVGYSDRQLLYRGFYICMQAPCGNRIPPQDIAAEASEAAAATTDIVRQILDKAPKATIVVVGYPWISPRTNPCKSLPKMTQPELDGANALVFGLNSQLQTTARQTGAIYVDMFELTEGHDVCSTSPWIRGTKPKDLRSALHPLAPEQKAATDAIIEALRQRR